MHIFIFITLRSTFFFLFFFVFFQYHRIILFLACLYVYLSTRPIIIIHRQQASFLFSYKFAKFFSLSFYFLRLFFCLCFVAMRSLIFRFMKMKMYVICNNSACHSYFLLNHSFLVVIVWLNGIEKVNVKK